MKKCDYCGKANQDDLQFCIGCGTSLSMGSALPIETKGEAAPIVSEPAILNARAATFILVIVFAAMIAADLVVDTIGMAAFASQGEDLRNARTVRRLTRTLKEPVYASAYLAGGVAMLLTSKRRVPESLADRRPTGGAWSIACSKGVTYGLVTGLLVGLCSFVIALPYQNAVGQVALASKKAASAAMLLQQGLAFFTIVVLAPLVEEPLFRGVLYGGYRRSFGSVWAAVLTTFLFCALHAPQIVRLPPAIVGLAAVALAALWFRLRFSAIGPAIAVHGGYNAAVTVAFFCRNYP